MKKQVIIYDNGDVALIQGNISVVHGNDGQRAIKETIDIGDEFNISDQEFESQIVQRTKKQSDDFVQKVKARKLLLKNKNKADTIQQRVRLTSNTEKATTFE